MKVRELQHKLTGLESELDVICYMEDNSLVSGDRGVALFEVVDLAAQDVERWRDGDGKRCLKFASTPTGDRIALLEITADL